MARNESNLDRIVRGVMAAALVVAGVTLGATPVAFVLYVIAAILAFTALTGFCPLYKLFGIDTCKLSKNCEA
jgi:hypothetical protein